MQIGGIESSIRLNDQMSHPLDGILEALNRVTNAVNVVNTTPMNIDASSLGGVNIELINAQNEIGNLRADLSTPIDIVSNMDMNPLETAINQANEPLNVLREQIDNINNASAMPQIDLSSLESAHPGINQFREVFERLRETTSQRLGTNTGELVNGLNQATNAANAANIAADPLRNIQINIDITQIATLQQELINSQNDINSLKNQMGSLIEENTRLQERFNDSLNNANTGSKSLLSNLKSVAGVYLSINAGKKFMNLASDMTDALSRVNLINDGRQTQEELNKMINDAAFNTYSDYASTLNLVTGLQISGGETLKTNQEAIAFAEQVNKHLTLSGASEMGKNSVMNQLPQILGKGKLQGQQFNTILANAPTIAQALMEYLDADMAKLRELGTEGKITGNILRNALFSAAEETNQKYEDMPVTMRDVVTNFSTIFLTGLKPIFDGIRDLASNKAFQTMLYGAANAFAVIANVGFKGISAFGNSLGFVASNANIVIPILGILTGVLIANKWASIASAAATAQDTIVKWATIAATKAQAVATGVLNALKLAATVATAALTGATVSTTAAQWGLNAAMVANPVGVVIGGIIVLIGLFYAGVAAINKFAGTNISAFGVITGVIRAAVAVIETHFKSIYNTVLFVFSTAYNYAVGVAEAFANIFDDPIATIIRLFVNVGNTIADIFGGVAGLIDKVLGLDIGGSIENLRGKLNNWAEENLPEQKITFERMNPEYLELPDIKEAYNIGYEWGKDFNLGDKLGGLTGDFTNDLFNGQMLDHLGDISNNTGKTADRLGLTNEEIKYLRDVAEQEVINRYTTANVTNSPTFNNNISNGMDLDTVVRSISDGLNGAVASVADGNYGG